MGTYVIWTELEDDIIRNFYPNRSNSEVSRMLVDRSPSSVKTRAVALKVTKTREYALKVQKENKLRWNAPDITKPNGIRHNRNPNYNIGK